MAASLEAGCQVESLYAPSGSGEDNTLSLIDKVAEEKEENEMLLDRMVLGELLKSLEKKQREIIVRRYFYNQTQTQIAEILGISQGCKCPEWNGKYCVRCVKNCRYGFIGR